MDGERWLETAGRLAGAAFVVLFLADIVITPGEPDEGARAGAIAAYYVAHRGGVLAVSLLHALAGIFFLLFVAWLVGRVRDGGRPQLARLIGYAGVAAASVALLSYACAGAAAYLAGRGAEPGVVQALAELRYISSGLADVPLAVLLAAGAAAVLTGAERGRWRGWLGAVAAVALLLGVAGLYSPTSVLGLFGFLGSILFAVWVIAAAVGDRTTTVAAAAPSAA